MQKAERNKKEQGRKSEGKFNKNKNILKHSKEAVTYENEEEESD